MKINSKDFRIREGEQVDLSRRATAVDPLYGSKEQYGEHLAEHIKQLSSLQERLYASDQYALLLIIQGMDAAGKDSAIQHVMSGVNPQGCEVFSFKQPSPEDLAHDFLWRTTKRLPERGRIGIFNRSYYEEVLVVRVHPAILENQGLPPELVDMQKIWKQRYTSIVDLERHLYRNGTRIVKFFLHVSQEQQRRRFLRRIEQPAKNWKFNAADLEETKLWPQYMQAYGECLCATSTEQAPWYVVPADDKKNARLIISQTVVDTLEALKLEYPKVSAEHKAELQRLRATLEQQQAAG